jgi:MHS family proline/betaine transporter-like MFS transporter
MSAKQRRFVFVSAISGNILEYYDFTVYTIFSIVLGKVFFPEASEFVQILSSLAVFAVGFVTRPIGGIVFGYIGDRYGRRISLICTMFGMTLTTFMMGFLPGYNSIGIAAPILLVILRLVQGLCISGEGAGAAIFVLEHFGKLRPGLITGLVNGSNITGTLLASLVGILLNLYCDSPEAWRYAFILGGIMGIMGGYLRVKTSETPIFNILAKKKQLLKSPFLAVVKDSWHFMILTCCVGGFASSVVYIVKAYVNVFYSDIMHLGSSVSLMYVSYTSFVLMICMPIAGAISDYIGRARMLKIAAVMLFIFTAPIMNFMGSENHTYQILAITALGVLGGAMAGGAYIFVISLFEPRERFSGVSFSYNLGVAIFGGTAPMISRWLVEKTSITYSPAFYLMFVSAIFLAAMQVMRKHIKSRMSK